MSQITTIAVLGGGGRTGRFLLSKLLSQNYRVKVLLRSIENFEVAHPLLEIVKGDATDPSRVSKLLEDCRAVISTIGQRKNEPLVASAATGNTLNAMAEHKIRRYILLGGVNIDTPSDKKDRQTLAATEWMKANFPLIHEERQKEYALLSESHLDWTLVRVPTIEFTDKKNALLVDVNDCPGSKITAGRIADFLIQQLDDARFLRQSPFIASE